MHNEEGPVTLADISGCQSISLSYLEQLFARLRRQKLVEGVRGPGGGYRLALPAEQISIATIIAAVDEKVNATCSGEDNCEEGDYCLTHDLWRGLSERIYEFLDNITLADILSRASVQEVMRRQDLENPRSTASRLPVE